MTAFLQVVTSVSSVVIAAAAVVAAIELRKSRFLVEELVFRGFSSSARAARDIAGPGQAIFICQEGQWVLAEDMSSPGFRAARPTMKPAYEGQVIKRKSIPKETS